MHVFVFVLCLEDPLENEMLHLKGLSSKQYISNSHKSHQYLLYSWAADKMSLCSMYAVSQTPDVNRWVHKYMIHLKMHNANIMQEL